MRNGFFIITGLRPYGDPRSSDMEAMAEVIARRNCVLYVDPPLVESRREKNCRESPLNEVKPNIWVLDSPAPEVDIDASECNGEFEKQCDDLASVYSEAIRTAARGLDRNCRDACLLMGNMMNSYHLSEKLSPRLTLLYYGGMPFPDFSVSERWDSYRRIVAGGSDIVVTDKVWLRAGMLGYNRNTYHIQRGTDLRDYRLDIEYPRPADLADIDTPIIGCPGTFGSIYHSVPLIERIAAGIPWATVVVLGEREPPAERGLSESPPNLRFAGIKGEYELPAYISAFDICIDPAVNPHPNSRYNDRIINCLALGKNVVCNDLPHIQRYMGYVLVAGSEDDFVEKVKTSLKTRVPWSLRYDRAMFAQTFSWESRIDSLYDFILLTEMSGGGRRRKA